MLPITVHLTPATLNGKTLKPGKAMQPAGVTIHNTGNPNANAANHAKAQANGNLSQVAVHYYVDDRSIYRCLSDTEQGWHAGDGTGPGNATTIAIEICEHGGIDQQKANQNGAELAASLLVKYGLSLSHLKKHQDFTGKYCPRLLIPVWNDFVSLVQKAYNQEKGDQAMEKTYTVVRGDTLSGIGAKLGIPWADIASRNGIKAPYTIYAGQTLRLPDSTNDGQAALEAVRQQYNAFIDEMDALIQKYKGAFS